MVTLPLSFNNIRQTALQVGFDDCGVVPAHPQNADAAYMDDWVQKGLHGNMSYLERNCNLRYNPCELVPGAHTVIVCVLTYDHSGHDYHRAVKSKLYELEAALGTRPTEGQNKFCDSAPFLERRWAVEAGLGFLGKNHQLIHPILGSYVHIGELVLTEIVDARPTLVPNRCAECRLCIDSCPGHALGQTEWDARRCVAYTTHHCLVCQQVCPMNKVNFQSL